MNRLNKFILLTFCMLGLGLSACNTMEGAGQDVENAGEAMQDAAQNNN